MDDHSFSRRNINSCRASLQNFTGQSNVRSKDKDALVDEIKKKEHFSAYFDEWVSSAELDIRKNVANDMLQQALTLYIK